MSLGIKIIQFDNKTDEVLAEKHTFKDFGLYWLEPYSIGFPEPDEYLVYVPGAYSPIDLTDELTGHTGFKSRKVDLSFEVRDQDYYRYEAIKMGLAEYIHGRKLRIILDTDPNYFYLARLRVEFDKNEKSESKLILTGEADPYKYNVLSSMDEWEWDPFSFVNGVIHFAKDLKIDGRTKVSLLPTRVPVSPNFICSSPMTVELDGEKVSLPAGKSQSPYIVLKNQDNELYFEGNGTVTIDYRGGFL